MSRKHTPGPWRVETGTTVVWGACDPDDKSSYGMGYPVADARNSPYFRWAGGPDADEGEANARLIAAAPEMREAAKGAREALVQAKALIHRQLGLEQPQLDAAIDALDAAIAKADGTQ